MQGLQESLRNTTEILTQAGGSGLAEPVQGAAAATSGASSSLMAPLAIPQPDVAMLSRQLEPVGHCVLRPICKYDIDKEKNEPFKLSDQMINDRWSDQQNSKYGSRPLCARMEGLRGARQWCGWLRLSPSRPQNRTMMYGSMTSSVQAIG